MPAAANLNFFYTSDRREWRQWLADNHDKSPGIIFTFYRKETDHPTLTPGEVVEDALCYGWIDGMSCRIDEERNGLRFSPRKPRSIWSKLNKERTEQLVAEGLITPIGLAKIEAAKLDGSWDTLIDSDNFLMPADLETALLANPIAHEHFHKFSPNSRKIILCWIINAKRSDTRQRRVGETVRLAALGKRANFPGEK